LTDALKLKQRILKAVSTLPFEVMESKNPDVKFALKYLPFKTPNYQVAIEYYPKLDVIRVVASMGTGKNLKDNYKKKTEAEQTEINGLFSKPIRRRSFSSMIAADFASVEGYKILIQQNLNSQQLLDTVGEAVFLIQDVAVLLVEADQSLKVPKASDAAKSMFG